METVLRKNCFQERKLGQRLNIILVAEGALDYEGKPITAERVKNVSDCHVLWFFGEYVPDSACL